jgi:LuxR family transcriptional regulator, maltose regulon positive regulatory protein
VTHLPFPFTKFLPPRLDARVSAGAIVARLSAAVDAHPLTIVSAPAGSGKTTAIAAWAEQSDAPVAWIRLDSADDSAPAAAAALLAGTQRVRSGFGRRLEQVLQNREASGSVAHIVTSLINDLGDGDPLIVVLDDFHVLTGTGSTAFFDRLLDQLPTHTRVVIGSRTEPALSLPRRRVRAQVAEFGLPDLRLDRDAIRRIIEPAVEVDEALVSRVQADTGGWAAAVRLLAARAQLLSRTLEGDAMGEVRGGRRGSARFRRDLWRYLTEEVWAAVPESLRSFLLETCILDEMTAEVCDVVRERDDSLDQLCDLERRNLFVSRHAGGDTEGWRYHDLFRDFLRERLRASREAGVVRELHRRAAGALPGLGGIEHLLAADEYDRAAQRIIEVGYRGSYIEVLPMLVPWIERLPNEVLAGHPRLELLAAGFDELRGRLAEVRARLEPLRAQLAMAGEPALAAEAAAGLVSSYIVAGDFPRARAAVAEALEHPLPSWLRAGTLMMRGWIGYHEADWADADASLEQALELAVTADDADVAKLVALGVVSPMLLLSRDRQRVLERTRQLISRLEGRETVTLAGPRCLLAASALLRLDVAAAEGEARSCLRETREFGGLPWIDQDAERLLLVVSLARGDHPAVKDLVEGAQRRLPTSEVDDTERWGYAYAAIRSDWLQGRRHRIAATAARLLPGQPRGPAEAIVSAIASAMSARVDGRFAEAEAMLRDAEDFQRESPFWLCAGLPGLERASSLLELGRAVAAIDAAGPTLGVAAELGPGILLSEVAAHRRVLEACAEAGRYPDGIRAVFAVVESEAPASRALPGTADRVSARELEVLRLVADGRSNRQVAEALFISEVTVKSHLTRVHRKLGARSRTHAVAIARELRLL